MADNEKKITIEIFRKKLPDDLTKSLADPDSRCDVGSAAALTAASAAALLARAAARTPAEGESGERVAYIARNAEILRAYMIHLIDEDVKSRGPLRRAVKEGSSRQTSSPAARTLPDSSASSRASSSRFAPREVLMMTTPSFIRAMVWALMIGPSAAGAWTEMKSERLSSSSMLT